MDPEPDGDADDTSAAPESGQPLGGRENPWDGNEGQTWPEPRQAAPKDEL